ncbi:MAG: hypothetical protein ACOC44_19375, partial [Promethearchaeia archaeon]
IDTFEMENPSGDNFNYTWSVEGYDRAEDYNFTIIAEDVSGNVNNTEGGSFEIGSRVALQIGRETNIIENTGYIGENNLTFLVAFRAYDEDVGTDVENITITEISIRFGNDGEYNEHFNFLAYNDSRIEDGLELEGSEEYTWVEIKYFINSSAPMIEDFMDEAMHVVIKYDYEDITESEEYLIEDKPGINASVNLYEIPEITQLEIITDPNRSENWLPKNHEISLRIYGSYLGGNYKAWINLTSWDIGESIIEASWKGDYYSYEMQNLESDTYDANTIDVILNTTDSFEETGLPYMEDTANFTDTFRVDADIPIIHMDQTIIPETTGETGFRVSFNITDNSSGIVYAEIEVMAAADFIIPLELSETEADIWEVMLTQENLGSESFEYEELITIRSITAWDVAGNENKTSIKENVEVDDIIPPVVDLENLEIDGLKGVTKFPANKYLSLRVNVTDSVSSSGIYYVRVYYRIKGEKSDLTPTADNEWQSTQLAHTGSGLYFGILSDSDNVGFSAGQEIIFYIKVSDLAGNVLETDKIELNIIGDLKFWSEREIQ